MRTLKAHILLGIFALANIAMMGLVYLQLGWISFSALFLSFFFMSIMFPTIFALGIWGLGRQAKIASSFIVMAIMGGAIMPKLMGWFSDEYGKVSGWCGRVMPDGGSDKLMSPGFIVPLFCFVVIALYGFNWTRLSGDTGDGGDGGEGVKVGSGGH
jgi:FHS family L-fucose permease-like MFS transporter